MTRLINHGFGVAEANAVIKALEIVCDGTRVQRKGEVIKQIEGCSLGPADSCDYADISLDVFLKVLVPKLEARLVSCLRFFRAGPVSVLMTKVLVIDKARL